MAKTYECKLCNYITSDRSNYSKHTSSKKHMKKVSEHKTIPEINILSDPKVISKRSLNDLKNGLLKIEEVVNSELKCDTCGRCFNRATNLSRHYKVCSERNKIKKENTELKKKLQQIESKYEKEIVKLEDDLQYYKDLVKDSGVGNGTKITTNVQSIILNKHDRAPALEYSKPGILQFDSNDAHENSLFLVNRYKDNTFTHFVGKCIVAAYKKEDPDEQSVWATDANRLTMFIKKMMDDDSKWISDKKGVQTTKYLIDPILKKIKEMLIEYNKHIYSRISKLPQLEVDYYNDIMINCRELVHFIEHEKLADEILKYMAPRLTYEIK